MPNSIPEQAKKLEKQWATGMTNYFMDELKDILPPEQLDEVREKLRKKFEERASKIVAKKWRDEMGNKPQI